MHHPNSALYISRSGNVQVIKSIIIISYYKSQEYAVCRNSSPTFS